MVFCASKLLHLPNLKSARFDVPFLKDVILVLPLASAFPTVWVSCRKDKGPKPLNGKIVLVAGAGVACLAAA
jgi:hypothetical protein